MELKQTKQTVEVRIGGEPFTTLHYGDDLPKPFFAPVHAPGGGVITRPIYFKDAVPERFQAQTPAVQGKIDHPHQKGIFLATDEVNDVKFWAEEGKIKTASVEVASDSSATIKMIHHPDGRTERVVTAAAGKPATIRLSNYWLDRGAEAIAAGTTILSEHTTITIHPNRLMAWDIRFTAGDDVTFDDTKEGMFGIRLVDSMRESEKGTIINSEGKKGMAQAWGQTADWTDYYGPVDGKTVGVALFDHPGNFRKSRYHVRNYGLFTMSPFGESAYTNGKQPAAPVRLKAGQVNVGGEPLRTKGGGETLRLRYGVYVHAGDEKEGQVAEAFRQFVK
ncbi:MAG: PmoA family protein [Planctomycetales bacterium]